MIEIQEDYFPQLPQLLGDPEHLRQAFLNLVINAFQAMPQGGSLKVTTTYKSGSNYLHVLFADTGKGIPLDIQDKVFDLFFTTKKHGGGLGLAIVNKIIDAHHGFIDFQSTQGKGTTFIVNLPTKKLTIKTT